MFTPFRCLHGRVLTRLKTNRELFVVSCRKTGNAGVMAEGKQRFAEYKQDKADGSVNWAQEGKDAMKDWKSQVCAAC